MKLLDVAGGTGDIAFRFLERGGGEVVVCDINKSMLGVGEDRAAARGFADSQISWVEGDAQALSFEDNSFDCYTIAFGIRNVVKVEAALRARRQVPVSGVLEGEGARAGGAVRSLLLPSDPAGGPRHRRGLEQLPVPGGEHPTVPGPGHLRLHDQGRGLRVRQVRESYGGHRGYSFRLQVVNSHYQ